MSQPQNFSSVVPFLHLIIFLLICYAPSEPSGFSLELIHRDSSESPLYTSNLSTSERISRLVESSKIRAQNLDPILPTSDSSPEQLRLLLSQDLTYYLVKITLGTPGIPLYLVPDTGSSLFWTQCEPCTHRYHQISPIFNSNTSQTYRKLTCEHPFCRNNHLFKCKNGECVYTQRYGSGGVTKGAASFDVFQSANHNHIPLYFGCSKDNRNFDLFERSGKSGGIMGLDISDVSFSQQLSNITHRRFSYCLVPYSKARTAATSLLRFGDDISTRGRRFFSTPIISPPNRSHYYLNLLDISVAGNRMRFPPGTFELKESGSGGCIIDSGAALTFVAQPAYQRLITAFKNYFDNQGLQRVSNPEIGLELCYSYARNRSFHSQASMIFHFQGADFTVEPKYVYLNDDDRKSFCVALKERQGRTIIGAVNQGNTRFIYDAAARQLLFSPENCLHDRI